MASARHNGICGNEITSLVAPPSKTLCDINGVIEGADLMWKKGGRKGEEITAEFKNL